MGESKEEKPVDRFVTESFLDELAALGKQDPYQLRRELLAKSPRLLGVLESAADKAGWGKPMPQRHGRGIAVHESFGSFSAHIAEVSVEYGKVEPAGISQGSPVTQGRHWARRYNLMSSCSP